MSRRPAVDDQSLQPCNRKWTPAIRSGNTKVRVAVKRLEVDDKNLRAIVTPIDQPRGRGHGNEGCNAARGPQPPDDAGGAEGHLRLLARNRVRVVRLLPRGVARRQ